MIQYQFYKGGFWFRVFGKGLSIVNRAKNPPLFSERNGKRKRITILNWRVNYLG